MKVDLAAIPHPHPCHAQKHKEKKSGTMNLIKFSDVDLHCCLCFTLMLFWHMAFDNGILK